MYVAIRSLVQVLVLAGLLTAHSCPGCCLAAAGSSRAIGTALDRGVP
ncbi:MAG: hypothetical protein U0610_11665 [bacterium]